MKLPAIVHKFSSPRNFYVMSGKLIPWLGWACALFLVTGLYYGLVEAPPDYQQGESYRIIFVHVPSAWMSMFIYMVMAISGAIGLIWRIGIVMSCLIPCFSSFWLLPCFPWVRHLTKHY